MPNENHRLDIRNLWNRDFFINGARALHGRRQMTNTDKAIHEHRYGKHGKLRRCYCGKIEPSEKILDHISNKFCNTDKATPRPWILSSGSYAIRELNGRGSIIARTNIEHHDCNHENAKLIVKAVNNHYQLLEACKAALACKIGSEKLLEQAIKQAESL